MRRALVLGGGGITGIAWEIGMLAGLIERAIPESKIYSPVDGVVASAGKVTGWRLASSTDSTLPHGYALSSRRLTE